MGPPVVNYYESVAVCLRVFLKRSNKNQPNMSVDADEIRRICDIYDWHGKGELDMYYFMDIFYALGMNLTKKTTVKYGQTDDVENELCKLYDKNENGTMMFAELETFLSLMGDEIPKDDCAKLLEALADPEDEDGFFPYTPFINKLCGKA